MYQLCPTRTSPKTEKGAEAGERRERIPTPTTTDRPCSARRHAPPTRMYWRAAQDERAREDVAPHRLGPLTYLGPCGGAPLLALAGALLPRVPPPPPIPVTHTSRPRCGGGGARGGREGEAGGDCRPRPSSRPRRKGWGGAAGPRRYIGPDYVGQGGGRCRTPSLRAAGAAPRDRRRLRRRRRPDRGAAEGPALSGPVARLEAPARRRRASPVPRTSARGRGPRGGGGRGRRATHAPARDPRGPARPAPSRAAPVDPAGGGVPASRSSGSGRGAPPRASGPWSSKGARPATSARGGRSAGRRTPKENQGRGPALRGRRGTCRPHEGGRGRAREEGAGKRPSTRGARRPFRPTHPSFHGRLYPTRPPPPPTSRSLHAPTPAPI